METWLNLPWCLGSKRWHNCLHLMSHWCQHLMYLLAQQLIGGCAWQMLVVYFLLASSISSTRFLGEAYQPQPGDFGDFSVAVFFKAANGSIWLLTRTVLYSKLSPQILHQWLHISGLVVVIAGMSWHNVVIVKIPMTMKFPCVSWKIWKRWLICDFWVAGGSGFMTGVVI